MECHYQYNNSYSIFPTKLPKINIIAIKNAFLQSCIQLYRKKHPLHNKMFMMVSSETKKIRKQILKYTLSIQKFFKYNPFDCPNCGKTMIKICWISGG